MIAWITWIGWVCFFVTITCWLIECVAKSEAGWAVLWTFLLTTGLIGVLIYYVEKWELL